MNDKVINFEAMMARNKTIISFSLDTELVKRIDDLADAKGMSRSRLVEAMLRDGIGDEHLMVKAAQSPVLMQALMKAFGSPEVLKQMAKVMGTKMSDTEVLEFQQGMHLMNNYGAAWQKSLPPELVAKKAVAKTTRENLKGRRKR
jgi:metal-responsive CopG/Arc/MetJ family transcriptional regulator